jgi:hypothetical protein
MSLYVRHLWFHRGSQNTLICAPSRFAGALAGRDGSPVVTEDAV